MVAKQKQSKSKSPKALKPKAVTPSSFKDRDLCKVNPLSEQFEPTEAEPIRQRARMAGY